MGGETSAERSGPNVILFAIAAVGLLVATGSPSIFELPGRLLAPVALIVLFRTGPIHAIGAATAGCLLLLLAARDGGLVLRTALPVGISGILLGRAAGMRLRPMWAVAEGALPYVVLTAFLFAAPLSGPELDTEIDRIVASSLTMSQEWAAGDEEAMEKVEELTRSMVRWSFSVLPAVTLVYLLTLTTVSYRIGALLLGRFGPPARIPSLFSRWRAPFGLVWMFAVSLGLVLLTDGALQRVGANGLTFAGAIYFIQGLSILAWLLGRMRLHWLLRAAMLAVAVFIALPFFLLATLSLGLFDSWFDFRRLDTLPESEVQPWK